MYVRFSGFGKQVCQILKIVKKVCICINIYFIYYFPPPSHWSNWLIKTLWNNTHICFQILGMSANFQKSEIYFKGAELTFILLLQAYDLKFLFQLPLGLCKLISLVYTQAPPPAYKHILFKKINFLYLCKLLYRNRFHFWTGLFKPVFI